MMSSKRGGQWFKFFPISREMQLRVHHELDRARETTGPPAVVDYVPSIEERNGDSSIQLHL